MLPPSQTWDGNDGRWSTFLLRVGTPEQVFQILPSTSSHDIFVPVAQGCDDLGLSRCASSGNGNRFNESTGVLSFFQANASTTWTSIGLHKHSTPRQFNSGKNSLYGFDTVGFVAQATGNLTLSSQVVAGVTTSTPYLGTFGLGPEPWEFPEIEYQPSSFMRTLRDEKKIPSLSFAYTAGAAYRNPHVPGSLTLGGYDAARFTPNEHMFPFSTDPLRVFEAKIQRITAENTPQGPQKLLNSPILSIIDSATPQLWLPQTSCDFFAQTFGLTYDPATDLYLVNDTTHTNLQALQPTITFHLRTPNPPSNTITISLPYAAFDLQTSHPVHGNKTNYFPIRRAANASQYTLGRTFLQEAYIIADYERSTFSVHQALHQPSTAQQNIITIFPPLISSEKTYTPQTPDGGLPKGAIIGIAAGVGVIVLMLLGLFVMSSRRRRARMRAREQPFPMGQYQSADQSAGERHGQRAESMESIER